jgi:pimeloyl-ACP methyl ester carboxylesterase
MAALGPLGEKKPAGTFLRFGCVPFHTGAETGSRKGWDLLHLGAIAAVLGAAGVCVLVWQWPPTFTPAFWVTGWATLGSLFLALGILAKRLIPGGTRRQKLAGIACGVLAAAILVAATAGAYSYLALGGTLRSLSVPETRAQASGRMIRLAYLRLPGKPGAAGPPIVYLAGGPGVSGIQTAMGARRPLFEAMREFGDVVALDQRGAGRLNRPNLACPGTWDIPLDRPLSREVAIPRLREYLRGCVQHWQARGVDAAAFNTWESAEDLEDLRKALGAEKLTLWGTSYGTHLALAYIKRHPGRVHRAILHGVEGLDHTWKLPGTFDRGMREVAQLAAATPEVARAVPDFLALAESLLGRLEREPVTAHVRDRDDRDPDDQRRLAVVLGKLDLQLATAQALGSTPWTLRLPAVYHGIAQGRLEPLAEFAANMRQQRREHLMTVMMDCSSGGSAGRLERIRSEAATSLLDNAMNFFFPEACDAVPAADLGDAFRAPVRADVPVLFFSGTLDARTPPANAEEIAQGFPASAHVILEGASHGDSLFLSSPQIAEVLRAFLRGNPLPSRRIAVPARLAPVRP